jgi:ferritin-like metal-binding protein YciE
MSATSLQDLYLQKLQMLLDAEQQTLQAMPDLIERVENEQLREVLDRHYRQTENHIERLRLLFDAHRQISGRMDCLSMRALIDETQGLLPGIEDSDTLDAFIIGAIQGIEHYEMAAYGTARTWAQELGYEDDALLLQRTLDEEGDADRTLTTIAEQTVNPEASDGLDREVRIIGGGQADRAHHGERQETTRTSPQSIRSRADSM